MPAVFFLSGVTYDTLTLTRIDRLLDNLLLLLYLSLLGVLIVLKSRDDLGAPVQAPMLTRLRPHYPAAIQFLLGGLFSAYAIFYSRSASWTSNAVFFGLLIALLIANEFLRDRLSSVRLLAALYALVMLSFLTFFLPVVTGLMNTLMFLLGAAIAGFLSLRLVALAQGGTDQATPRRQIYRDSAPALAVLAVLVLLYFVNWIPPVPLSLKFGGLYHEVEKVDDRYRLGFEAARWYQLWKRSDTVFHGEGPAYCFTAVFAPVDLKTTIYHHWQYRAPRRNGAGTFTTTDRIPMLISGGREEGYRGYTVKSRVTGGDWRVDVETEDGRIVGRVAFRVEPPGSEEGELDRLLY